MFDYMVRKNSIKISNKKINMEDHCEEDVYALIDLMVIKIKNNMINLHEAARNISYEEIRNILFMRNDVNPKDDSEAIPLHYAAGWNNCPLVLEELINAGSDIRARDNIGRVPLHYSARYNTNSDITKKLVSNTSDIQVIDKHLRTPLHHASRYNTNEDVVLSLIDGKTILSMDVYGKTPLQYASCNSNKDIFRLVMSWRHLKKWWERY